MTIPDPIHVLAIVAGSLVGITKGVALVVLGVVVLGAAVIGAIAAFIGAFAGSLARSLTG